MWRGSSAALISSVKLLLSDRKNGAGAVHIFDTTFSYRYFDICYPPPLPTFVIKYYECSTPSFLSSILTILRPDGPPPKAMNVFSTFLIFFCEQPQSKWRPRSNYHKDYSISRSIVLAVAIANVDEKIANKFCAKFQTPRRWIKV